MAFLCRNTATNGQAIFPEKCIGEWIGMMQIFQKGQLRDSVSVKLTVKKIDSSSFSWKTEYLSEKMPVTKDYVLRRIDKSKNKYVTDEGDGVLLEVAVFDNKCYSVFETDGIMLTSRYELIAPDTLSFEVTSSRLSTSFGSELKNYDMSNLQTVVFKKLK